jgi:hypothetical protein
MSLTQREEHRSRDFECNMLREVFGSERRFNALTQRPCLNSIVSLGGRSIAEFSWWGFDDDEKDI